jgi:hypothetical protein
LCLLAALASLRLCVSLRNLRSPFKNPCLKFRVFRGFAKNLNHNLSLNPDLPVFFSSRDTV